MTSPVCDEELLSSTASFSPPLSLKSGTLELPHNFEPINLEVICTPEHTNEIKPPSSNASFVNLQPNSSTLNTRHLPTPPPSNLHITIDNATYTVPTKNIIYLKFLSSSTRVFFLLYFIL